ncbi:hypothetical protein Pmani_025237 [Petrolisthes manimaculis]|uniref:Uncharacterized protein n=1 Tax=Petrolisthes manimaculis TaxID=1843537 RepID=A0AAE1P6I8_9EUCA|nr:hypothetical protein Pmani_025237 [Petrolisthes manimaculis]
MTFPLPWPPLSHSPHPLSPTTPHLLPSLTTSSPPALASPITLTTPTPSNTTPTLQHHTHSLTTPTLQPHPLSNNTFTPSPPHSLPHHHTHSPTTTFTPPPPHSLPHHHLTPPPHTPTPHYLPTHPFTHDPSEPREWPQEMTRLWAPHHWPCPPLLTLILLTPSGTSHSTPPVPHFIIPSTPYVLYTSLLCYTPADSIFPSATYSSCFSLCMLHS